MTSSMIHETATRIFSIEPLSNHRATMLRLRDQLRQILPCWQTLGT
jgi:hypothetical protein